MQISLKNSFDEIPPTSEQTHVSLIDENPEKRGKGWVYQKCIWCLMQKSSSEKKNLRKLWVVSGDYICREETLADK